MSQLGRFSLLVKTAIRGILMHRLRSLLTVLGLVFGVSSVIVMLAVAEGASLEAQRQIAALGINNVIIRSVKPSGPQEQNKDSFELDYGLTYDDLRRIKDAIPSAVSATPMREYRQEARYGANKYEARIVAVQPGYFATNQIETSRGRLLVDSDVHNRNNVCVIGSELAKRLFPGQSPVGDSVQVANSQFFQIVGVQQYKTPSSGIGSSLSAQDLNYDVVVPITTDRSRTGDVLTRREQGSFSRERMELSQITVSVANRHHVKSTGRAIEGLLSQYHPRGDFVISLPLDLLEQAQETQRIFNIVLGATAAISLLVGGIGIMNIMLASVSERTREIGIRRALGARQSDIVMQFLFETATLSLLGTVIGVVVGVGAPGVVGWLSGMKTSTTTFSVIVAAAVAMVTGLLSGIYPASRAAQLDPIEALRHE